MFERIRWMVVVMSVAIAMLAPSGSALAGPDLGGVGSLDAKDLVQGTVTIESEVYRVTEDTLIQDVDGKRVALAELSMDPGLLYEYELSKRDSRALRRLSATEMPE